jgi:hypothetical protein
MQGAVKSGMCIVSGTAWLFNGLPFHGLVEFICWAEQSPTSSAQLAHRFGACAVTMTQELRSGASMSSTLTTV